MINLTEAHVAKLLPGNKHVDEWHKAMMKILPKYNITSVNRVAGFIAQCAHESNNFTVLEENLNYSATALERVFSKYFSKAGRNAKEYAKQPEKIANIVYANRLGNGNTASGDGYRFRGHGIIQLTGRENYTNFGKTIGKSAEEVVAYLKTIEGALEGACWYWSTRNINSACDSDDIEQMTRLINGGTIGLSDRTRKYNAAKALLKSVGDLPQVVDIPALPEAPVCKPEQIKRGDRGDSVVKLQKALGLHADGIFGVATEAAVRAFQARNGLTVTGVAGPTTLAKLMN